ncbi:MAG: hypothetical protein JST90_18555 [Bacteroidetes bacterium]|nr:hypothetical protein [Bacteroidota bacterium]
MPVSSNRKKKKKKKKNPILGRQTKPWVAVKNAFVQMGSPYPDSMSAQERLKFVREIGSKAKEELDVKYPALQNWFKEYDALYLLSFCAYYLISHPQGLDPEISGKGTPFFPHYLEILQAFSLSQKRNVSAKPLLNNAITLEEDMKHIGMLLSMRMFNIPSNISTDEDMHAYRLRNDMIMNTTAVRNWAYSHQMERITLELSLLIDEEFEIIYGVKASVLVKVLFEILEHQTSKLNTHRNKALSFFHKKDYKQVIQTYNQAFSEHLSIEKDASRIWDMVGKNLKALKSTLVCHSDLFLHHIFSFTLAEAFSLSKEKCSIDKLRTLLDKLSFQFGDLENSNWEHFVLSNPVNEKPFIKIDENTWFTSLGGALPHFSLSILEDLIWDNTALRVSYTQKKAEYLEDEVERIFREGFPSAQIYRGSMWSNPLDPGVTYENDLIMMIDSFAVIVEAKSGTISDPAKRGAPQRLFETLQDLIESPAKQSLRFVQFLKDNKGIHHFATKKGETHHIDNTKIKYYIPLGVTFSHLGTISSNLKKMIQAGVVKASIEKLVPSINVTDLESVFELLPLEAEKLHYLSRRREIEAHLDYEGDELDLLAFYLEQGFNIGEIEYSKEAAFNLIPKSKELDPYFIAKGENIKVKKPELAMTKWWRDILTNTAQSQKEGWLETSFILLNSTKEDQIKFEKKLKELKHLIIKGKAPNEHNWLLFTTGPKRRFYAIAAYPYINGDTDLRNDVISRIIEDENAKDSLGIAVIGVDLLDEKYPYTFLARRMSTSLFDDLLN